MFRTAHLWKGWFPGRCLAGLGLLVSMLIVAPLQAGDAAAARQLFEQGLKLLDRDQWDEACPKFKASMDMFATVGAKLNVAKCAAHYGKFATALSDYEHARLLNDKTADVAHRKTVHDYIETQLKKLKSRVPKLTIQVDPKVDGLQVKRNDKPVPLGALGTALPVDPGSVTVEATAPGFAATSTVDITEGQSLSIKLVLQPVTTTAAPTPVATTTEPDGESGGIPTWVWIVGSVGIASAIVGVVFAVDYRNAVAEMNEICNDDLNNCQPSVEDRATGPDAVNSRKDRAIGLGIGFGTAGGIALTAAIIGVALSGSASETDEPPKGQASWHAVPWVGPAQVGGQVTFSF